MCSSSQDWFCVRLWSYDWCRWLYQSMGATQNCWDPLHISATTDACKFYLFGYTDWFRKVAWQTHIRRKWSASGLGEHPKIFGTPYTMLSHGLSCGCWAFVKKNWLNSMIQCMQVRADHVSHSLRPDTLVLCVMSHSSCLNSFCV